MSRPRTQRVPSRTPGLEVRWPGKEPGWQEPPAIGPRLVVDETGGHDTAGQGGWQNRLLLGDNVRVGASLRGEFDGQVDLVYLDPPFATGDRFSFTAAVGDEVSASAELAAYDDRFDPGALLAMLAPRLALGWSLLAPTGLMFVHLDARASHGVKLLLDELATPANFRGEIVWVPGNGAKSRRFFARQHQTLLVYGKSAQWTFDVDHPTAREPFAAGSLRTHFRQVDEAGRRFRRRVVGGREYVYFADEGRAVGSVWNDIPAMVAGSPVMAESTGYPTQKPLKLLERIVATCSRPGGLVADLCIGSGTTLVAAERLGRRWLGCDVSPLAVATARKRLLALDPPARPFAVLREADAERSAAIRVRASVERQGEQARVTLDDVTVTDLPDSLRDRSGLDLLDAWSLDTAPADGAPFAHRWHAQRTRQERSLVRQSPWLPAPGPVRVWVADVLGRTTCVRA